MRKIIFVLAVLLVLSFSKNKFIDKSPDKEKYISGGDRVEELDNYWSDMAKYAKEGNFEGMKSMYHEDGVVVKPDTTFSVTRAFKVRWKKEIMEVKEGLRANNLEFRFFERVGDNDTAYEKGIFHYSSIETATGKTLSDGLIHFETLLVKKNGKWLALMESQKEKATPAEWEGLK